jgi:hypothetical protein
MGRSMKLSNNIVKRLSRLDAASAYIRHITRPFADAFVEEVMTAINGKLGLSLHTVYSDKLSGQEVGHTQPSELSDSPTELNSDTAQGPELVDLYSDEGSPVEEPAAVATTAAQESQTDANSGNMMLGSISELQPFLRSLLASGGLTRSDLMQLISDFDKSSASSDHCDIMDAFLFGCSDYNVETTPNHRAEHAHWHEHKNEFPAAPREHHDDSSAYTDLCRQLAAKAGAAENISEGLFEDTGNSFKHFAANLVTNVSGVGHKVFTGTHPMRWFAAENLGNNVGMTGGHKRSQDDDEGPQEHRAGSSGSQEAHSNSDVDMNDLQHFRHTEAGHTAGNNRQDEIIYDLVDLLDAAPPTETGSSCGADHTDECSMHSGGDSEEDIDDIFEPGRSNDHLFVTFGKGKKASRRARKAAAKQAGYDAALKQAEQAAAEQAEKRRSRFATPESEALRAANEARAAMRHSRFCS